MASKKIVLGSGLCYVAVFDGEVPATIDLEKDENLIGYIQGGANITYTPSFYEAKDDLGYVQKKMLTEEEVKLATGVMTWNGQTLSKLCSTARITEDGDIRTVKIGGIGNYDAKKYVIRFHHVDKVDGDIRVTIVGNNEAGFEFNFAKDKETVVNAEFKAMPLDADGTLIIFEEELKELPNGDVTGDHA